MKYLQYPVRLSLLGKEGRKEDLQEGIIKKL
jgi:hypothetical protein